jgi:hypothetical protein
MESCLECFVDIDLSSGSINVVVIAYFLLVVDVDLFDQVCNFRVENVPAPTRTYSPCALFVR